MSLSAQLFGRDSFIFKATNALGLGIPGWLDKKFGPKDTEGPRLDDLSVQTSTYGADIPRLYGTISIAGNILWLEGGKLKEVVKKNKKGGKGGASATPTKTYTYYATFALGLCEGPIAGVRRIWCSDTLLYNAGSDDLETIIASNANAKGWKLYLGSEDQQPDARYEADVGPGNAPAFRGLAYLAFYDFELTNYANTLQASQFKVEVVRQSDFAPHLVEYTIDPISRDKIVGIAPGNCYSESLSRYFVAATSAGDLLLGEKNGASIAYSSIGKTEGGSIIPVSTSADSLLFSFLLLGNVDQGNRLIFGKESAFSLHFPYSETCAYVCDALASGAIYGVVRSGAGNYVFKAEQSEVAPAAFTVSEKAACDGQEILVLFGGYLYSIVKDTDTTLKVVKFDLDSLAVLDEHSVSFTSPLVVTNGDNAAVTSGSKVIFTMGHDSFGINLGAFDPESLSVQYIGRADGDLSSVTSPESPMLSMSGNTLCWAQRQITPDLFLGVAFINPEMPVQSEQTIGSVILAECNQTGYLSSTDISVDVDGSVAGYKVASGTIRSAIEPLQSAYPFDVIQSGYQVRFKARGKSSVTSIPMDDLYAGEDGGDEALSQSREMDSQLPNTVVVKYLDADREYDVSQQQYKRASTSSVDESSLDLSIVMTADKAAQVAEIMCYLAWLERVEFSFTLPPIYAAIEPSDVITLYDESVSYELRITETTQGIEGRTECKAVPNRAALYTSQAVGGTGSTSNGSISLPGKSLAVLLDIPVVDETVQNDPGFVAAVTGYTSGWPGAVLIGSSDNGQTYADLQGFAGKGTIGTVTGSLKANGGTVIDLSSIRVSLISGQLESVTRDQMLSGVNYAAYGEDGRWEIVRFQSAVLQADGSYVVSGFVRGQRGTEWATGLHGEGDWFVLLDDADNAFIDLPASALSESRLYKAVTSRQSADDAAAQELTYKGVNLQPLSPVYARGSRNAGSLTVTWTRRSRLSNSWWSTGVVAPLGEDSESYQVDVMSGSSVVRTITSNSAAITYTAAQQQTDFGSVQSAITLRIFQISAAVGRGRALEVTL